MNERKSRSLRRVTTSVLVAAALAATAPVAASPAQALREGQVEIDARLRAERVEQDGLAEDAEALTLRIRLGYRTDRWLGLAAFAEAEHVEAVVDDFNSTANGKTALPIVADPEDTEINQAYLEYALEEKLAARLGRQRITLDNHRFIGNVGWRQNEQTYDGLWLRARPLESMTVVYAHLENANRIFGEHNPNAALADLALDADLANVSLALGPGRLTAYAYLLEFDDLPLASQRSIGVRYAGRLELREGLQWLYTGEYADQSDYRDGASFVDAEYYLLEAGLEIGKLTVKLGHEVLGGDGSYGFATPLATLHAFNGWTDKFLVTPPTGLRDSMLSLAGKMAGVELLGVYHDFSADSGGADFGTELGFQAARSFGEMWSGGVKYARYDADTFSTDTDKLWLWLEFKL